MVLPDADAKFFVDAAADIRATRRHLELKARGENIQFSEVLSDIIQRDCRDKNRTVAPLIAADDAFFIDSSDKNADEVLVICLDYLDGSMNRSRYGSLKQVVLVYKRKLWMLDSLVAPHLSARG